MKQITKDIKDIFEDVYLLINSKYPLEKPSLKIVHYISSTKGAFYHNRKLIRINSNFSLEKIRKTLIHEFCHYVNQVYFNPKQKKKLGHNVKFWEICLGFNLKYKDYGYGLTNNMKKAYNNLSIDYDRE